MSYQSQLVLQRVVEGESQERGSFLVNGTMRGSESCRGVALAAEWLAEHGKPYDKLWRFARRGVPHWMQTIGPIAVSLDRLPGTHGRWTRPTRIDEFAWLRALHNLQMVARLWPVETEQELARGVEMTGYGQGHTRLTWSLDGEPCELSSVVYRVARNGE